VDRLVRTAPVLSVGARAETFVDGWATPGHDVWGMLN